MFSRVFMMYYYCLLDNPFSCWQINIFPLKRVFAAAACYISDRQKKRDLPAKQSRDRIFPLKAGKIYPCGSWINFAKENRRGPLFYKGWYHFFFYQYNPNAAVWGDIYGLVCIEWMGVGFVVGSRIHTGQVIGTLIGGLRITTNYVAETVDGRMSESHYFVTLEGISVQGVRLQIDPGAFARTPNHNGGCLLDTGSPWTAIHRKEYDIVKSAMQAHFSAFHLEQVVRCVCGVWCATMWAADVHEYTFPVNSSYVRIINIGSSCLRSDIHSRIHINVHFGIYCS
ncbi:hypothetical protein IFM89_026011 [Coptis chinensis]|uniref:Xylanase inhibitor C-terminal domain-containing protein n=1 Tax=Coptis chinensis TaxID=261450 RepID=A0A835HD32_9MAGN|nr:hypothetical protein IFM89_026011 [Coptis chinensis]